MKYWNHYLKGAVLGIGLLALFSFVAKKIAEEKTYNIKLTLPQAQRWVQGNQYIYDKIRHSNLPANEVSFIADSLLAPMNDAIMQQITQQQQEELKPKDSTALKQMPPVKKDSTVAKPKRK